MADVRYLDCPNCKRANVMGYAIEEKENKYIKGGGAAYGAALGAALGGPLGAAVGLGLGKIAGDLLADTNQGETIKYTFRCPNCGKEWSEYFPYTK